MRVPQPSVIAVVPAHNEEELIAVTLGSLLAQSRPPDRILVMLDNCTDGTEAVVAGFPAVDFVHTVDNQLRKAGALVQAMPACQWFDWILVVDGDAELEPHFLERGLELVASDPKIGAMSCREGVAPYRGHTWGHRLAYAFVRYQRYLWDSARMQRPQDTEIMVGNGMLVRTAALLEIGGWNVEEAIEDTALGIDLRLGGWRTVLGSRCFGWSDTPLDWRSLYRQRVRWGRGEMVFFKRPWRRGSWRAKLTSYALYALALWYLILVTVDLFNHDHFNWLWLAPLGLLYADRLTRIFRVFPEVHWIDLVLALPPCELLLFFLYQAPRTVGLVHNLRHRPHEWHAT